MDNNDTYVKILINTLEKKEKVLDDLYRITIMQENILKSNTQDMDAFNNSIDDKEMLIQYLNELDAGFETIYDRVKLEMPLNKDGYREDILKLQELIMGITDKSVKLQALELRNKVAMESFFVVKKKEVKEFKKNSQSAANYYKNMVDRPQGESYFLDKKN